MAIAGHRAMIEIPSELVTFTAESTSTLDDLVYQIDDIDKRVWCSFCNITVYDGGVVVDEEEYSLNRLTGKVIFETAETRDITVDGQYHPMFEVGEAFDYTYTLDGDNLEKTTFGESWISRAQGLKDVSGSFTRYFAEDKFFQQVIDEDKPFVIRFYSHREEEFDIICRVKGSSSEPSGSVDGLVEDSFDFEGTNDADKRSVSVP